ncbi:MAG: aspartate dehydrogenase [Pseudomonadota bacterium]
MTETNVAVIGRGPIARYVAGAIADAQGLRLTHVLVRTAEPIAFAEGASVVTDAAALEGVDVVADCAGHGGLSDHGEALLSAGCRLITLSAGAFADEALHGRLVGAARRGGGRIEVVAGAVGAVDALSAASVGGLEMVRYVGRKPPAGWRGTPAERHDLEALDAPLVHFEGDAREAALAYPKNANVAATIALAGIGFERTTVQLIADPAATANTHTVDARGAFGAFTATFSANALPDNPRSSALAAMSMARAILDRAGLLVVG